MPEINWIAVFGSTLAAFLLGGLWYGPLFSEPWMREMGVGRNFKPRLPRSLLFALAIGCNFLGALVFALVVGPAPSPERALLTAVAIGLAWVAPSLLIVYLFADRSCTLTAIDSGYAAVQFVLMGVVFALAG